MNEWTRISCKRCGINTALLPESCSDPDGYLIKRGWKRIASHGYVCPDCAASELPPTLSCESCRFHGAECDSSAYEGKRGHIAGDDWCELYAPEEYQG